MLTLRKNPEPVSLRQSEAAYSNALVTPATALEPCVSALAIAMDHSSDVERGVEGGGGGGGRLLHG